MSPRARVRARGIAALLVTALAVAGCGGDDDPGGTPKPTGSASTSGSPSESSSGSSESPTEGSTFGAPATGALLELDHAAVNAPDGWVRGEDYVTFQQGAKDATGASGMALSELPAAPGPSLEEQAANSIRSGGYVKDPTYQGTVVVHDVVLYHVAGMINGYEYQEEFGTIFDNAAVTITLYFKVDNWTEAERQAAVDSVLASVKWKETIGD